MYKTIEAALINGKIKILEKQPLPKKSRVLIILLGEEELEDTLLSRAIQKVDKSKNKKIPLTKVKKDILNEISNQK